MGSVCSRNVTVKQRATPNSSNNGISTDQQSRDLAVNNARFPPHSNDQHQQPIDSSADLTTRTTSTMIVAERESEADDNGTAREENDSGLCSTSDVVDGTEQRAHNGALEGRNNSTLKFDNYVQSAERKQSRQSIGYYHLSTGETADCDSTEIDATDVSAAPLERPPAVSDDDRNTVNVDDSGCDDGEAADQSSAAFLSKSTCQVTDARYQNGGTVATDPAKVASLNGAESSSNNCRQLSSARRGSSAAERVPSSRVSSQDASGSSAARTPSARTSKVVRPRQKSASDAMASPSADNSPSRHHQPSSVHPSTTPLAATSPELEPVANPRVAPVSQQPVQASTGSRRSIANGVRTPVTSTAATKSVPSHVLVRRKSNRFFDTRVFAAIDGKSPGGKNDGGHDTKSFDAKGTWKLAHNRTSNNAKTGPQQKRFAARPQSRTANNRRDTRESLQSANKRVQPAAAAAADGDETRQQEITAFVNVQLKQSQEQPRSETRSTNRSEEDKSGTTDDVTENETNRRVFVTMRLT